MGQVHGDVGHDGSVTDQSKSNNPVLLGSKYIATAPSVSDGDAVFLRVDASGRLLTGIKNWENVDYGSYTITGSADTLFDFADGGSPSSKPATSKAFMGTLETANIRMRGDGTSPTASEGQLVYKGSQLIFTENDMENLEMIRTGSTSAVLKGHFVTAEAGDLIGNS